MQVSQLACGMEHTAGLFSNLCPIIRHDYGELILPGPLFACLSFWPPVLNCILYIYSFILFGVALLACDQVVTFGSNSKGQVPLFCYHDCVSIYIINLVL